MSVTFSVPEAPITRNVVPCDYGKGEEWACLPGNRCGYCDDGEDEVRESAAPEINVGNVTAAILLDLLQLPNEPYGSLLPLHIAPVRRRIVRVLSTSAADAKAIPEGAWGGPGTGHARVIECGLSGEQIRERLTRLDAVLAYAQAHGQEVSWG